MPRRADEDQQIRRSYDSQSEDSEDAEREAEYESSEEEDSMDGELGRLCRAGEVADGSMSDASESEGESGELRAVSMADGGKSRTFEATDGLSALGKL